MISKVAALCLLASGVRAEGEDTPVAAEGEDTPVAYESPTPDGDYLFFENFDDEAAFKKTWTVSAADGFDGEWGLSAGSSPDVEENLALEVKNEAQKHAIAAPFPTVKPQEGEALVIQYEIKLEKAHNCGGMYLKLLKDGADLEKFDGASDYSIMFGPDKCGATDKTHFIMKHENPITKDVEEKHANNAPPSKVSMKTQLFTLIINADSTYEYLIDQESMAKGSLLETMEPAVNPPKEIDDPTDSKPTDWADEAKMDDPEASKPDDWDEDAPAEIVDETKSMPDGWDEDAPDTIADPSAEMPDDWDEEEDGDWEAPKIANPQCEEQGGAGCGKWVAPKISNPDYKGKWYAPKIDNPEYKGEWKAKQIPNPAWFEDKTPAMSIAPFSAIGFELWTMTNGIFFDNILITRDPAVAESFATKSWKVTVDAEKARDAAEKTSVLDGPKKAVEGAIESMSATLVDAGIPQEYTFPTIAVTLLVILGSSIFFCCFSGGDGDTIAGADSDDEEEEEPAPAPAPAKKETPAKKEEKEEEDAGPKTRSKTKTTPNPAAKGTPKTKGSGKGKKRAD